MDVRESSTVDSSTYQILKYSTITLADACQGVARHTKSLQSDRYKTSTKTLQNWNPLLQSSFFPKMRNKIHVLLPWPPPLVEVPRIVLARVHGHTMMPWTNKKPLLEDWMSQMSHVTTRYMPDVVSIWNAKKTMPWPVVQYFQFCGKPLVSEPCSLFSKIVFTTADSKDLSDVTKGYKKRE